MRHDEYIDNDYDYEYSEYITELIEIHDIEIEDKINLSYFIGTYENVDDINLLFGISVSPRTFFKFEFSDIKTYFEFINRKKNCVDIMQLVIIDDMYTVLIKTFWLKVIQRKWKKIFKLRKTVLNLRKTVTCQNYFRINGRYPYGATFLPNYQF